MRLGQILVASGVVDSQQLSAALRQQVVYGGRVGTNVIELGYADADQVARALARQHGVPAALKRHLERHDPAVLQHLPAKAAHQAFAFPVAFSMAKDTKRLVVCMRDPGDQRALELISHHAGVAAVPCVAPELLVHALLERFYGLARPRRMAVAQHGHATPLPGTRAESAPLQSFGSGSGGDDDFDIDVDIDGDGVVDFEIDVEEAEDLGLQLVDLDDAGVVKDLSQYSQAGTQQSAASAIAHSIWATASAMAGADVATAATAGVEQALAAANASTNQAVDLNQAPDLRAPQPEAAETPAPPPLELNAALSTVNGANHRDEVSSAVLAYMRGRFGGGLIFLAKDGLALADGGFGGLFDDESVQSIVVPLSVPSAFQHSHNDRLLFRGAPPEQGKPIQDRFFKLFPLDDNPCEILIAPVVIKDRVVCLYYAHGLAGEAMNDAAVIGLSQLADAASGAFVRMIRGAKRPA